MCVCVCDCVEISVKEVSAVSVCVCVTVLKSQRKVSAVCVCVCKSQRKGVSTVSVCVCVLEGDRKGRGGDCGCAGDPDVHQQNQKGTILAQSFLLQAMLRSCLSENMGVLLVFCVCVCVSVCASVSDILSVVKKQCFP